MTPDAPAPLCRQCGRPAEKLDPAGWCSECRAEVVRRAGVHAWGAVALAALPLAAGYARVGAFGSRFLVLWVALAAAFLFLLFKVARRVGFEVIRGRALRAGRAP